MKAFSRNIHARKSTIFNLKFSNTMKQHEFINVNYFLKRMNFLQQNEKDTSCTNYSSGNYCYETIMNYCSLNYNYRGSREEGVSDN